MNDNWCRLSEDLVSHICEVRRAKQLGVHVGVVELPVNLARFDLTEYDLLLDIV